AGAEERGDGGDVRVVAGAERGGGLLAEETCELLLQLEVQRERTRQQAYAAGGRAVACDGLAHGGLEPGMADEAEIAVRREHDERRSEHGGLRPGAALERELVGVERLGQPRAERVEPAPDVRRVEQRSRLDEPVAVAALEKAVERIAGVVGERVSHPA